MSTDGHEIGTLGWVFLIIAGICIFLVTVAAEAVGYRPDGSRRGEAGWYGQGYAGFPMANGRPFDPDALTCASWDFPIGARLLVCHGSRSVSVRVTDRGPARSLYDQGRIIDLSRAAFAALAPLDEGVISVCIFPTESNQN